MSFFDSVKDKVSAIFTTRDLNLDDYAAEPQLVEIILKNFNISRN